MKLRNGFVSNSSSSSFIIDGDKTTCVDVAISLFEQLNNNDYIEPEIYNLVISNLNNITDKNTGVFYSMNDDLIISKVGKDIIVSATNHISWDIDFITGYGEEYEYYDSQINSDFFFPDQKKQNPYKLYDNERYPGLENKYKKEWIYSCENKKCSNRTIFVTKENMIFCPNCLCDPDGNKVMFREAKLKRILDIE